MSWDNLVLVLLVLSSSGIAIVSVAIYEIALQRSMDNMVRNEINLMGKIMNGG